MAKITTLTYRLSGGSGNTSPAASIGGAMSNTAVINTTDNNLFDDIDLTDAATGKTYYRCIYVLNEGPNPYPMGVAAWISSQTPSNYTKMYIGAGVGGGTEPTIADEHTAPAGVTFYRPTSEAGGMTLGGLSIDDWVGLWIRIDVSANSGGAVNDYGRISFGGSVVTFPTNTFGAGFIVSTPLASPLNNSRATLTGGYIGYSYLEFNDFPYLSDVDYDRAAFVAPGIITPYVSTASYVTHYYANNNGLYAVILPLTELTNLRVFDVSDNLVTSYGGGVIPAGMTALNCGNNALNVASVNQLAIDCNDANLGAGFTLTMNGGTNAAPAGDGATAVSALQGRGATVLTN